MNRLIAIEGPDGAGKSTLLKGLSQRMEERGIEYRVGRQPGGTPLGERLRELLLDPKIEMDPLTQIYIFMASRSAFFEKVVRPTLADGKVVICDRLDLSTVFYQSVMMKYELIQRYGFNDETIRKTAEFHKKANQLARASEPDIPIRRIVLDAPDDILDSRRPRSAVDRFEAQDKEFQIDMRAFYRQYEQAHRKSREVMSVPGDAPFTPKVLDLLIDWITEEEGATCPKMATT